MLRLTVLETVKHATEENAAHERDGRKVSFINMLIANPHLVYNTARVFQQ